MRTAERHMGMPEESINKILEMTLKNLAQSNFWKIPITSSGGRGVEDFKEEFEE